MNDFERLKWLLEEVNSRDFYTTTPELKAFIKHLNSLAPVVYEILRTENNGRDHSENSHLISGVIGGDAILKSTLEDAGSIMNDLKRLTEGVNYE